VPWSIQRTTIHARTHYREAFDDAFRASSLRIYIQGGVEIRTQVWAPGREILTCITRFRNDYVVTKDIIKGSSIGYKMVGAREVGCTREHQHAIEKVKKQPEPEWGFV